MRHSYTGRRLAYYAGIAIAGSMLGWPLGLVILGHDVRPRFTGEKPNVLIGSLFVSVLVTVVVSGIERPRGK